MSRASPIQDSFNAGEFSPLMESRITVQKRGNGCKEMTNFIPAIQGPAISRPGTKFIKEVKDSTDKVVLIPFEFNVEQAYILEFGDLYFRVYKDHGAVLDGGTHVEVVTPYTAADLYDANGCCRLQWAQTADILYIVHQDYPMQEVTRTSHTAWTIADAVFVDGPYGRENTDATKTLTPSATTGSVTITATGHSPFASTDVGRLVRMTHSTTRGFARITAFTSSTQVTATVVNAFGGTGAVSTWRLGIYSETTGFPSTITFFEDRMFLAGATDTPQRIDGSKSGEHLDFSPTSTTGTVADDNAIGVTINSDKVNHIVWITDDEKGLAIGTVGGEWIMSPSNFGEALTPTNIKATRATTYGSAHVSPIRTGKSTLFVQRSFRKIREMAFVFESDGFRAPDMTVISEHVTGDGILMLAQQQEPHSIIWAVRADGVLIGFSYDREQEVIAWHKHPLGGTDTVVESIACIPTPDKKADELWLSVSRTIDGGTVRYIEYMTEFWREGTAQEDAFCVDCGLTYDSTPATTITGLDHLEGEEVVVLADGAAHPNCTVSSGSITLSRSTSVAQIGLYYEPALQTLRVEAGSKDGTSQGKVKRIEHITFRFYQTLGAFVGPDADNMDEINFREGNDLMDAAPALFDGDKGVRWQDTYSNDGFVRIEQRQPFPMTVIAIMPQVVTEDRG